MERGEVQCVLSRNALGGLCGVQPQEQEVVVVSCGKTQLGQVPTIDT
jgi:hypothetical protein